MQCKHASRVMQITTKRLPISTNDKYWQCARAPERGGPGELLLPNRINVNRERLANEGGRRVARRRRDVFQCSGIEQTMRNTIAAASIVAMFTKQIRMN